MSISSNPRAELRECLVCGQAMREYGHRVCAACRRKAYADKAIASGAVKIRSELGRRPCTGCGKRRSVAFGGLCAGCLVKSTPTAPAGRRPDRSELEARLAYYQARAEQGLPLFDPPFRA